ncbi:MAG TPA: hypothetical protein VJU15_13905 [Gemmatimonadales bacterium]|nr:hypothetical protein [Gemmatimonadales bacterium]
MRRVTCVIAMLAGCGGAGAKDAPAASTTSRTASTSSWPDACSLLTQAEAEAVLGALVRAPYPDSTRRGCAYETAGNKTFVITPEWQYGKLELDTERMVGGMAAMVGYTPEAAADTLEGAWDEVAFGITGIVFRVKARSLTVNYEKSSTNLAGALKLARPALERLGAAPEPARAAGADDKCPLRASVVSEIMGQEVRPPVGPQLQDACDFELAIDPTVRMQLKIHPENLGDYVFEDLANNAKGILGQSASPKKVEIGEGGMMWASTNSGGEIAVKARGKVYHARLAVGITSSSSISEEALLKLAERMVQ